MIKLTQSTFFIKYACTLFLFTEFFMLLTIVLLFYPNFQILHVIIFLILSPILGAFLTKKDILNHTIVTRKSHFYVLFFIITIMTYFFIYLINFRINIVLFSCFTLGVFISLFILRLVPMKLRYLNTSNLPLKHYKLIKFNSENIKNFLKINNLENSKYIALNLYHYILFNKIPLFIFSQFIICFDESSTLHFFELSKFDKKKIINHFSISFNDLHILKKKKHFSSYNIIFYSDTDKIKIVIPRKIYKLYTQNQYSTLFYKNCYIRQKK